MKVLARNDGPPLPEGFRDLKGAKVLFSASLSKKSSRGFAAHLPCGKTCYCKHEHNLHYSADLLEGGLHLVPQSRVGGFAMSIHTAFVCQSRSARSASPGKPQQS